MNYSFRENFSLRRIFFYSCFPVWFIAILLSISIPVHAEETIRFGASLSLTGRMATEGRLVKDGYDFYVKHVNAMGGIPIKGKKYKVEIIYYDDESDPKVATKLVEKLIVEDKIRYLLGPYSRYVADFIMLPINLIPSF